MNHYRTTKRLIISSFRFIHVRKRDQIPKWQLFKPLFVVECKIVRCIHKGFIIKGFVYIMNYVVHNMSCNVG